MISRMKVSNFIPVKVCTANTIKFQKGYRQSQRIYIYDKLTKDNPNDNYNILNDLITTDIETHFATNKIRYNKHKHKKSNWITQWIIKSISYRDKIYQKLKCTSAEQSIYHHLKTNLRTYNKILKTSINTAKITYYQYKFYKFKNDMNRVFLNQC